MGFFHLSDDIYDSDDLYYEVDASGTAGHSTEVEGIPSVASAAVPTVPTPSNFIFPTPAAVAAPSSSRSILSIPAADGPMLSNPIFPTPTAVTAPNSSGSILSIPAADRPVLSSSITLTPAAGALPPKSPTIAAAAVLLSLISSTHAVPNEDGGQTQDTGMASTSGSSLPPIHAPLASISSHEKVRQCTRQAATKRAKLMGPAVVGKGLTDR